MSIWGIMLAVAAILAIVVTALIIGVCLLIAWASDTMRGSSPKESRGEGGEGDGWQPSRGTADGRHRNAQRMPVASRRGGR